MASLCVPASVSPATATLPTASTASRMPDHPFTAEAGGTPDYRPGAVLDGEGCRCPRRYVWCRSRKHYRPRRWSWRVWRSRIAAAQHRVDIGCGGERVDPGRLGSAALIKWAASRPATHNATRRNNQPSPSIAAHLPAWCAPHARFLTGLPYAPFGGVLQMILRGWGMTSICARVALRRCSVKLVHWRGTRAFRPKIVARLFLALTI